MSRFQLAPSVSQYKYCFKCAITLIAYKTYLGLVVTSKLPSFRRGRNLHRQLQTLSCPLPWMVQRLGSCS